MTKQEKARILEYLWHTSELLEQEYKDRRYSCALLKSDELDCLELIIARSRLRLFSEISKNLRALLTVL